MRNIASRLDRLERAIVPANAAFAFISYAEGEKTKADAIAEWEAENGPIEECAAVFLTVYEAAPGDVVPIAGHEKRAVPAARG